MRHRLALALVLTLTLCASAPLRAQTPAAAPPAAGVIDRTPRIAVISAFEPELATLLKNVDGKQSHRVNGVDFTTGELRGKPVVLFLSGVSMVNAAMNTQLAIDRFAVTHILFSGIAGGVNPALNIGDVVVAEKWGQYLEVVVARETEPGKFAPPPWQRGAGFASFGMLFPQNVGVRSKGRDGQEKRFWFEADARLLAIARELRDVPLADCDAAKKCLGHKPRLVIGGNGVSGAAFVDNAAFREYAFKTFEANVLDMETAATAQVAYANGVPYIAFRSLSDLAGGGKGDNEIATFFKLAADNSANVLLAYLAAWK